MSENLKGCSPFDTWPREGTNKCCPKNHPTGVRLNFWPILKTFTKNLMLNRELNITVLILIMFAYPVQCSSLQLSYSVL